MSVIDGVIKTYLNDPSTSKECKECFCNDLCIFVLLKKGRVTTCSNWKERVMRVVEREKEKDAVQI